MSGHHFDDLVSYSGILIDDRGQTSVANETAAIRFLRAQHIRELRSTFDGYSYDSGRTQKYSRGQLLGFYLVAVFLGKHLNKTHAMIQASAALREELGLTAPSQRVLTLINDPDFTDDVLEDAFPSRQELHHLPGWMQEFTEKLGVDVLGDLQCKTYIEIPTKVLREHRLNTQRLGIDSKVAASANKYRDRRRNDGGASQVARQWGRYKQSAVLVDIPLVLASAVSSGPNDTQLRMARKQLLPMLGENCRTIATSLRRSGKRPLFENAAVIGDGVFESHDCIEATLDQSFLPCYRNGDQLNRRLIGQRSVTKRGDTPILLDQADDGTLYCPCTRGIELVCRTPMRQITHSATRNGKAEVWCDRDCHVTRGVHFFVTWGSPTHNMEGKPIPEGDRTLVGVGPVWKGDMRTPALIHKGENAIENYHKRVYERTLMGSKDHSFGRRRVWGDYANHFWWTLADLVWNDFVWRCLDKAKRRGIELRHIDWRSQFYAAVAIWRRAQRRKAGLVDNYIRGERARRLPDDPLHCPMWAPGHIWIFEDALAQ